MKALRKLSLLVIAVVLLSVHTRGASAQSGTNPLQVDMPSDRFTFSTDADFVITGTMMNNSDNPVGISFRRYQALPKAWTTSVCFGTNCFAAQVDSAFEVFGAHESREFILHVNPRMLDISDSGWVYLRVRAETGSIGDTVSFLLRPVFEPGQPPIVFQLMKADSGKVFTGNGPFVVGATFQNRSADTLKFVYQVASQLPTGWTGSLCLRDSCASLQNGSASIRYTMVSLVSQTVRMRIENTTGVSLTEPDSAVFYLTVKPQTKNSADSMVYRFVAQLLPAAGVTAAAATPTRLLLGSVYPNPLAITGGSAEVSFAVQADATANVSLALYDVGGKVIAQLPCGIVERGISTRSISLRNVEPGAYFARVSDGTSLSNPVLVRIER